MNFHFIFNLFTTMLLYGVIQYCMYSKTKMLIMEKNNTINEDNNDVFAIPVFTE